MLLRWRDDSRNILGLGGRTELEDTQPGGELSTPLYIVALGWVIDSRRSIEEL